MKLFRSLVFAHFCLLLAFLDCTPLQAQQNPSAASVPVSVTQEENPVSIPGTEAPYIAFWRIYKERMVAVLTLFAVTAFLTRLLFIERIKRIRTQNALKLSEAHYQATLNAFAHTVLVLNKHGACVDIHARNPEELHMPREQILGKTFQEFLPPELAQRFKRKLEQGAQGSEPDTLEYSLASLGQSRFYETRFVRCQDDQYLAITRDLTEKKRAEEELESSRRFIERIAETMPNVLFIYDLVEQRNVYVNSRSAAVIGFTAEEVIEMGDQFVPRVMHPDDLSELPKLVRLYAECSEGDVFESIFRMRHKNGQWRWVHRNASVFVRTADGKPKQIIGTATDITTLKQTEKELQQLSARLFDIQDAERRRISRELHDTTAQNLFAVTLNLAAMQDSTLPAHAKDILEECQALCDQSLQEIRTLAYLLHPPMLDRVGLVFALQWYVEGLAKRTGIELRFEPPEAMDRLTLELETDLFRVAQEGLANIVRHSGSKQAVLRLEKQAHQIVVSIIDFGHGIPVESDSATIDSEGWVGVGISGMRERLRRIGGLLEIVSNDQGTKVVASVLLTPQSFAKARGSG